MKKHIFLGLFLVLLSVSLFAEVPKVKVTEEKIDQNTMKVEFIEEYNQATFTYTVPAAEFNIEDCFNAVNDKARALNQEHNYSRYYRNGNDMAQYDSKNKLVRYVSVILFEYK